MPTPDLAHEQNLYYAGVLTGRLHMEGIKLEPKVENGRYTGELDIEVRDRVHILIKVTGAYNAIS